MPQIVFTEYRDKYKETKYPFADTATLLDMTGEYSIPEELFIDASIYVPGSSSILYISELTIDLNKATIVITDRVSNKKLYGYYTTNTDLISLVDDKNKQLGVLVLNSDFLSYFKTQRASTYEFDEEATLLSARCIMPLVSNGVTSIHTEEADESLTGDIWLIGHNGVQLSAPSDTSIRIDIIGDPLFKKAACDEEQAVTPRVLQNINGVTANDYGDLRITTGSSSILRVNTTEAGIVIHTIGTL